MKKALLLAVAVSTGAFLVGAFFTFGQVLMQATASYFLMSLMTGGF